jgi:hypothetical protein
MIDSLCTKNTSPFTLAKAKPSCTGGCSKVTRNADDVGGAWCEYVVGMGAHWHDKVAMSKT